MIIEIFQGAGAVSCGVPALWFGYRALQVRSTVKRKIDRHLFEPTIRRDMHGPHVMNRCTVCRLGRKAWIHTNRQSSDAAEGNYLNKAKLLELERAEIKWRFSNDQEWVQVFGGDYDPKTFDPIPQFHNGECGGPNDSCERCAWEADQAQHQKDSELREITREKLRADRAVEREKEEIRKASIEGYLGILWTVWNTVHDYDTASEEFTDICDELGMLTDPSIRKEIRNRDVYKRLHYCLSSPKYWPRREETWQTKRANDLSRRHYF